MSNIQQRGQQFKIVLLGEGCVGKTSLVLRYVNNKFEESHQSTLQASFLCKKIFYQNLSITLNIWDTAGQERFHALGPIYYRESNGALLVYDVTDPDSFAKVKVWVKELRKMLGNNVSLAIVGNKIDLLPRNERQEMNNELIMEAKNYAQSAQATHFVTSAKTNFGIDELFFDLTKRMLLFDQNRNQSNNGNSSFAFHSQRGISVVDDDDHCERQGLVNGNKRSCC